MAKDPVRNVDRKKIRGGQFNEFDFARHHRQEDESGQTGGIPVNSEQVKADRIKRLLAKYGASLPGEKKVDPDAEPAPVGNLEPTPALSDEKKVEPETKSMPASTMESTPVLREEKQAMPETKTTKKPANPTSSIKTAKPATTGSTGEATSKAAAEKAKPGTTAKAKSSPTRAKSSSATARKAAAKGRSPGARKS